MDDDLHDDDLHDDELARALHQHAVELTGGLDVADALASVQQRGRARRRRRVIVTGVGAAAASIVLVAGLLAVASDDRELVRAPATEPTVAPTTTLPPSTTTPPTTTVTTATTVPPATTPTTTPPSVATAPEVRTYESTGGSIRVHHADGAIALDGEPVPNSGWTARIEDNGPNRVRVRFERGNEHSEIRVDLVNGQLVDRIS
jgi:hypothetical protein